MRVEPGYESLAGVLQRALDQAQSGKGAERHADSKPFHEQPMQRLCELYGVGFALGQAAKKSQESTRLPTRDRQVAELLGAINYLAGAVIFLEGTGPAPVAANDNGVRCGLPTLCDECIKVGLCLEAGIAGEAGAGADG